MPEPKVSLTTKDVSTLVQLRDNGQLKLQPEFQREGVWPKSAKSYFVDSILNNRPIPPIYVQRATSVQTGRNDFAIIDGQQRIRAVLEFLADGFPLSEVGDDSAALAAKGKKFSTLPEEMQKRIWNFDFVVQELSGYSDADIRDIFTRMNKYVIRLSKQELRHAKETGKFKEFVERMGKWRFWRDKKVFTTSQLARMRATEFGAELTILLIEGGPQHQKIAIDLYYKKYSDKFPEGSGIEAKLREYIRWIGKALPNFESSRYRRSNEFYALIGAVDSVRRKGVELAKLDAAEAGKKLHDFEAETHAKKLSERAAQYVIAASKHTDDLEPRKKRIEILESLLG